MAKESVELEVAGRTLEVSSPSKVYFPELGVTKLDVVEYYIEMESCVLSALSGRPVLLERFPNGVESSSFFQKRVPKNAPEWLRTVEVSTPNGTTSQALVIEDLAHLIWAVNLGCIGFHVWPNKADDIEIADQLRIDLDPSPGQTFADIVTAAKATKQLLDELEIDAGVKTSGNKGLHIYAQLEPEWTAIEVRQASVAIARELERRHPEMITASWWKEERGERVFVDYNQNAPHKTVFGTWCVRPVSKARVSTPFPWEDIDNVKPASFTIENVPDLLSQKDDPWAELSNCRIDNALEMYQTDLETGLMDAPWPPQYPKQPNEPPRVQPSRKADKSR